VLFFAQKNVQRIIPLKSNTHNINGLSFGTLVAFIKGVRGQGSGARGEVRCLGDRR